MIALDKVAEATDADATDVLRAISPGGLLEGTALIYGNAELDELQNQLDAIERAVAEHLAIPPLRQRLEDDLAVAAPAIIDAVNTLDGFWIPLLSALAGPAAPLVSFGCKVAISLALAIFKSWALRRLAAKPK